MRKISYDPMASIELLQGAVSIEFELRAKTVSETVPSSRACPSEVFSLWMVSRHHGTDGSAVTRCEWGMCCNVRLRLLYVSTKVQLRYPLKCETWSYQTPKYSRFHFYTNLVGISNSVAYVSFL